MSIADRVKYKGRINKEGAKRLRSNGLSLGKIANVYGVTKAAVRQALLRQGVSTTGKHQKEGKFIACTNCGKKVYRAQSQIHLLTFCNLQCRDQYKLAHPRFTKEQLHELYWGRRLSLSQIGKIFRITRESVRNWFKRYDIPRRAPVHNIPHTEESIARIKANHHKPRDIKPTAPERALIKILKEYNLPYRYVGNGAVWFEGYNPDFININGAKGIIEVFGTYWHRDLFNARTSEWGRAYHYAKYGFKTLILWENELENEKVAVKKIKAFTKGLGGIL